jgi:hypothetical protein
MKRFIKEKWHVPIVILWLVIMISFITYLGMKMSTEANAQITKSIEKVITTKPAIPKLLYHSTFDSSEVMNNAITTLYREGYVNIKVSGSSRAGGEEIWFLIAEKY